MTMQEDGRGAPAVRLAAATASCYNHTPPSHSGVAVKRARRASAEAGSQEGSELEESAVEQVVAAWRQQLAIEENSGEGRDADSADQGGREANTGAGQGRARQHAQAPCTAYTRIDFTTIKRRLYKLNI
jgi:hypothetical protein